MPPEGHANEDLAEADRLMTICNACRYCEGLCAVFPAMEMRRVFTDGDLNYLANLCHDCGACYDDCQFSPPHEFNVDVPRTLARIRAKSYENYAWPPAFSRIFERNGLRIGVATAVAVLLFMVGFVAVNGLPATLEVHLGEGAFYALMPHRVMVAIFGAAFLYALLALAMSARNFRREKGSLAQAPIASSSYGQAAAEAARLRYLDGGGVGCAKEDEASDRRALFHHFTSYGFALCFAATAVATLEHYLLGREAPYPWYEPPVVLGIAGGLGLLIGPAGLLAAKLKRNPAIATETRFGMDIAFVASLFLTSLTGFALLLLRGTSAMGILLALHLGIVLALFFSLPYGKFVHGLYRYLALARYAQERRGATGDASANS
jgi:citrate/tricarballylate utilization protein